MKTVKIGFLGMGNVGSGAYEILQNNARLIEEREGLRLIVKRALVRSLNKARPGCADAGVLTTDPLDVLDDPEIEIVAEFFRRQGTSPRIYASGAPKRQNSRNGQ